MSDTLLEQAAKAAIPNNAYGKIIAQILITSFLDIIKDDPEAYKRIMDAVIRDQFRSDIQVAETVIEALKQEVNR